MTVYCRGCNREAKVFRELGDSYVERNDGKTHYHPKIDCDVTEYFTRRFDNIKPEVQRKDIQ